MNHKISSIVLITIAALVMAACQPAAPSATAMPLPTTTPRPTNTATATSTATSAPSETPAPASGLAEPPAGFEWQVVPEVSPALFLVPNGWYFKAEQYDNGSSGYFITKEDIAADAAGQFSTGMAIYVVPGDNGKAAEFAKKYIADIVNLATTAKVIGNSESERGNLVHYSLQIEAEYTNLATNDPNRKKVVNYDNIANKDTNIVYLVSFESPTPIWTEEWKTGKLMINNFFQQLIAEQLIAESEQPTQAAPANTTLIPHEIPELPPIGMPPAAQSNLFTTIGGGFQSINIDPTPGKPWQQRYGLNLETISALPSAAVLEAHFENPLDTATTIVVSLAPIPSGQFLLESPLLSGFKCKNYWIEVHAYSDASQTDELGIHLQWINSNVDTDKITSALGFMSGQTPC